MPGLSITHQSLNAGKSEKQRKWKWPKWLKRKKPSATTSPQKVEDEDSTNQSLVPEVPETVNEEAIEVIVQEDFVCLLCLQQPEEWFTIEKCGCKFCLQCMEMYAHCCISSGNVPISCPDGQCPSNESVLSGKEVRHLVTNDIYHLYHRLQLNTEVATNPKLTWCPRPGCETVCQLSEDAAPRKSKVFGVISVTRPPRNQSVVCSTCQFSFCSQCKTPWHVNSPCPSLTQVFDVSKKPYDPEDPISKLEKDGQIKRCPFCQVPIERDDGCAQMMCKNCRHVFCWFCLASLDDDFMLRHYDSGPCRSRLGHSRISVVWHRTQVVSAFLGLGVLFLVTSPLLLLVSPCFFCWRHHSQKSSEHL